VLASELLRNKQTNTTPDQREEVPFVVSIVVSLSSIASSVLILPLQL
jgi:hypothetical protein